MGDDEDPKPDGSTGTANKSGPAASFTSVNSHAGATTRSARALSRSPPPRQSRSSEVASRQQQPNPPLESQPMTATTSSSSLHTEHPANNAADANGASPYGTRSRNKAGASRPNYAEDREPEVDFEWGSSKKSQAPPESSSITNTTTTTNATAVNHPPSTEIEKSSGTNTRRSSAAAAPTVPASLPKPVNSNTTPNPNASPNAAGHQIPGMSSFSLNPDGSVPAPTQTRKRKAPGSGHQTQTASSVLSQISAGGSSRKQASATTVQGSRTTQLMTFENCNYCLKNGKLKADDGTTLAVNDQVYLICEPPGEPYYLGRLMEFLHVNNDPSQAVDSIKVNWFLRPRDIPRKVNDTRLVFATFQTQICPVTSLRGKCKIVHRNEISDLESYRKTKDCFWYEKLFDRYIHRFYEVIPTTLVINVPKRVKTVLDERWHYVVVEIGRGKELTSAIKSCKKCSDYCASNDSVDCAHCKNTYHMNCIEPPLLKKPARGFGWSCAACNQRMEKKLELRDTPTQAGEDEEEEIADDDAEDRKDKLQENIEHKKQSNNADSNDQGTQQQEAEQKHLSNVWPYRYLGIHCRVEDALDYDDRIYPRASSRLGPKHQANVHVWHGRPVRLVRPKEVKKRHTKSNAWKNQSKMQKETSSPSDANKSAKDKRPKWIQDEPPGYVARGDDHSNGDQASTAHVVFRLPEVGEHSSRGTDENEVDKPPTNWEELIDEYMEKAKAIAPSLGVEPFCANFLDKALETFTNNNYDEGKALNQLANMKKRKDLKEPDLSKEEVKRFEEGVSRYGSELRNITRHMGKGQKYGEIVRFYYIWKKTPSGQQIWDHYDGRKGKKQAKQSDSKLVDDVADDVDDSAFDNGKALARRRGFECKFCCTRQSPQWRRAPGTQPGTTVLADPSLKGSKDKSAHLMVALCQRCAGLWRKYGIQWENIDEVAKKVASGGGKAWRRRIDEELLSELVSANQASHISMSTTAVAAAASIGVDVPPSMTIQPGQEGSKKRQKIAIDAQPQPEPQVSMPVEPPKKKEIEKPPEPPLIPEQPRVRTLPCAVCYEFEPMGDQHLCCRHCRLTVHRNCYGVPESKPKDKWACDMCMNDMNPQVATTYECVLCTVTSNTDTDVALLMDPPRVSHKKKSDRERERERLEKEMIDEHAALYFKEQEAKGRPTTPRQPLKKTSGNNWVHVVCAVFHPEIKFSNPKALEIAEGFGAISPQKLSQKCKHCKMSKGACINCSQCQAPIHVACAQQFGHHLVFDVNPVKQSRKDAVNTVGMAGEYGNATAVVYCREHGPKHQTHRLCEVDEDSPFNALQRFARSHKQADLSITGTTRKANMVQTATKTAAMNTEASGTRSATAAANTVNGNSAVPTATRSVRVSPSNVTVQSEEVDQDGDRVLRLSDIPLIDYAAKRCEKCGTDSTPKWHKAPLKPFEAEKPGPKPERTDQNGLTNGEHKVNVLPSNAKPSGPPQDADADVIMLDRPENEVEGPRNQSFGRPEDSGGYEVHIKTEVQSDPEKPAYFCHKCYLRKLKNPTPPRIPTPPPPPPPQPEPREKEQTSPRPTLTWPQPPVPPPPRESYRRWSGPSEPTYHGPDHIPNGINRSPVVAPLPIPPPTHQHPPPPPPPQPPPSAHYPPHPPHPAHPPGPPPHHYAHPAAHQPPPPPPPHYSYRPDSRDRHHAYARGVPIPYHVPPHGVPNGYTPSEPPSFQYRRDPDTGMLLQVPYVPPSARNQPPPQHAPPPLPRHPPRGPPLRSPTSAHRMRSPQVSAMSPPSHHMTPPTRHARSPIPDQGPHGPPEADSNPFAVPYTSHASPRPPYQNPGLYESPRPGQARPATPDYPRDGRWPNERPVANGASESPSVRNLLR